MVMLRKRPLTERDLLDLAVVIEQFEDAADEYAEWLQQSSHKLDFRDVAVIRAKFGDRILFARAAAENMRDKFK